MSSIKEYKCLNCKAGLEFDPPSQKWKCHYCFSDFTKEALDSVYKEEELPDEDMPELDSYNCTSCGAELITESTVSATSCLYCKSPTIIKTRFSGRFKPKSLIPFRLTKQQAEDIYRKWIGKRLLAPSEFKTKEEIEKITGIYAPHWLFDCQASGSIEGEATKVSSWSDGDYNYTQTKYYRVARRGKANYKQIPVDASKKLDDTMMHKIEPYDYNDLTDFSMQYMSGFMAEKYDVEADEAEQVMQERVDGYMEGRLRETIGGYSSFTVSDSRINLLDTAQSYSMMPIYLLVNKYKGKNHTFIINGQTGKVVGDTPISLAKQLIFAGVVFAAVWLLGVFGGALFV